jgi:hypothetical protein
LNSNLYLVFGSIASFFRPSRSLLIAVLLCFATAATQAQSVTFAGSQETLPFTGLVDPMGETVDSMGNVFVADAVNNQVVELPWTGIGYGQQIILPFASLSFPVSVAVDSAGNVFAAELMTYLVVELPKTSTGYGTQTILPFSGLQWVVGVAVDKGGDVFVTDSDHGRVVELPWTGTNFGPQTTLPFSGMAFPNGVAAIDSAGDVFLADTGTPRVLELPWTGTGYGPQITLPFGFSTNPWDVALDSAGDVFVADLDDGRIAELPKTASGYGPQMIVLTGSSYHMTVDGAGNVYFPENHAVQKFQRNSVYFGGAGVCTSGATTQAPCSQTLTLKFNVNSDVTLGFPGVHTGGAPNLDFTLAKGATCIGAVTAGSTCIVKVTFAPLAAGYRYGSVQIIDSMGTLIAATPISGFGIAATTGPPVAQLSTTYMPFGTIQFGSSETMPLTVANIGGGTLTVTPSISSYSSPAPNTFAYSIAASTCGAGVTPGTACTLVVEFSPPSIAVHDDLLTLQTNASANPTVKLHGTVSGLSVLSGASLEFGSVTEGSTKVLPLTVTNVGLPGTVTLDSAITVRATARPTTTYKILTTSQNTCLAGITAGQSCVLPVEFAPTSSGTHDDLLTLSPSSGGGSTRVWLTGSTP